MYLGRGGVNATADPSTAPPPPSCLVLEAVCKSRARYTPRPRFAAAGAGGVLPCHGLVRRPRWRAYCGGGTRCCPAAVWSPSMWTRTCTRCGCGGRPCGRMGFPFLGACELRLLCLLRVLCVLFATSVLCFCAPCALCLSRSVRSLRAPMLLWFLPGRRAPLPPPPPLRAVFRPL
jgi:hypothetical protein